MTEISLFYPLKRTTDRKNFTRPETEHVSLESLSHLITSNTIDGWSHIAFWRHRRNNDNFKSTSLIVLDIDKGCSLEQATELFKGYRHIIGLTKSHTADAHRFRVVLFLDRPITKAKEYSSLWKNICSKYSFIDPSCCDVARYWFSCKSIYSVQETGSLLCVDSLLAEARKLPVEVMEPFRKAPKVKVHAPVAGAKKPRGIVRGIPYVLPEGQRSNLLVRIAGSLVRKAHSKDELARYLFDIREERMENQSTFLDSEVLNIVEWIWDKEQDKNRLNHPFTSISYPPYFNKTWDTINKEFFSLLDHAPEAGATYECLEYWLTRLASIRLGAQFSYSASPRRFIGMELRKHGFKRTVIHTRRNDSSRTTEALYFIDLRRLISHIEELVSTSTSISYPSSISEMANSVNVDTVREKALQHAKEFKDNPSSATVFVGEQSMPEPLSDKHSKAIRSFAEELDPIPQPMIESQQEQVLENTGSEEFWERATAELEQRVNRALERFKP